MVRREVGGKVLGSVSDPHYRLTSLLPFPSGQIIFLPLLYSLSREQTPRGSRMTCREKTERQEMQVLSRPEFI